MQKNKNILLLWSSYQSNNLGSQALFLSNVKLLGASNKFHLISFYEKSSRIEDVQIANLKISLHIHKFNFFEAFRALIFRSGKIGNLCINTLDFVVDISEGDSFTDIYGPKRFILMLISKIILLKNSVKIIAAPQTIGPFKNALLRHLAKNVLKKYTKVFARDLNTKRLLDSMNISSTLSCDVAFKMSYEKVDNISKTNGKPLHVGINVSSLLWNQSGDFSIKIDYQNLLKKTIMRIKELGHSITLVPHVYSDKDISDLDVSSELALSLPSHNTKILKNVEDCIEIKSEISKFDFFIGSRMHSTIASVSSGVPTIALGYSYKYEGVFELIGYPYYINLYDYDASEDILNKIIHLIRDIKEVKQKVSSIDINKYNEYERYINETLRK